jgi:hypothetical protein
VCDCSDEERSTCKDGVLVCEAEVERLVSSVRNAAGSRRWIVGDG